MILDDDDTCCCCCCCCCCGSELAGVSSAAVFIHRCRRICSIVYRFFGSSTSIRRIRCSQSASHTRDSRNNFTSIITPSWLCAGGNSKNNVCQTRVARFLLRQAMVGRLSFLFQRLPIRIQLFIAILPHDSFAQEEDTGHSSCFLNPSGLLIPG